MRLASEDAFPVLPTWSDGLFPGQQEQRVFPEPLRWKYARGFQKLFRLSMNIGGVIRKNRRHFFTVEQFPQSGRAVGGESGNQRRGATVNVHRWYKAVLLMLQSYHHDLLQGAARNDPFHPDGNDGTEFPC